MANEKEVKIKVKIISELKKLEKITDSLSNLGKKTDKVSKEIKVSLGRIKESTEQIGTQAQKSSKRFGFALTLVAWHFRYLGSLLSQVSKKWQRVIQRSVETAAELQESFISIRVAAKMYGSDADKATELSKKLALTGLLPLTDAATDVMRLMVSGLGVPTAEKLLYRALDVGTKYTSGMDEMTKTLDILTKSILRGQLVMSEQNTVARMIWNTTRDLLKQRGIDIATLTKKQRALALLNTIETHYADTLGLHKIEEMTLRAQLNKMRTSITLLYNAYGNSLAPIVKLVSDRIGTLTSSLLSLMRKVSPSIAVFTTLGLTITMLSGGLAGLLGALISVKRILEGLSLAAGATVVPFGKLILVGAGVGLALTGLTYLVLRHSKAWEKLKEQYKGIENAITHLGKAQEEQITGVTKKEELAHKRRLADYEEQLQRERSKGLWANQMTIKDLEKRIRREKEDWALTQEEKGKAGKKTQNALIKQLDEIDKKVKETNKTLASTKSIIEKLRDPKLWGGINIGIMNFVKGIKKNLTNFTFWKYFISELFSNIGKAISFVGDVIKAMFEGLFGSVMNGVGVAAALTFVVKFGKALLSYFSTSGIGFLAAKSAGAAALTAFRAALPATLVVAVALEVGAAIYEAIKFKKVLDGLFNTVDKSREMSNRAFNALKKQFLEGKITAEEFKKQADALAKTQEIVEKTAEGARWNWKQFIFGEYFEQGLEDIFKKHLHYQFGGVIPGLRNEPVPVIAHGGERIIPAGEVGTGGNIVVNINNPSVRSETDIQRIAEAVKQILSQRNRWARLGAY